MALPKNKSKEAEVKSPGKFMIALGGFLGFGLPFASSLAAGNTAWTSLLYGGLGCVLCAFLMQQFAIYIEKNIDRIRKEKVEAERQRRLREEMEDDADLMNDSNELTLKK